MHRPKDAKKLLVCYKNIKRNTEHNIVQNAKILSNSFHRIQWEQYFNSVALSLEKICKEWNNKQ